MTDKERAERAVALAVELLDAYEDACHQGSGEEPLSSPTWHHFTSTWEQADELIPRARLELASLLARSLKVCDACEGRGGRGRSVSDFPEPCEDCNGKGFLPQ